MSRAITLIAYMWLLAVEAWEYLVYSVRERLLSRASADAESRIWRDQLRVLPPAAVH